MKVKLKGETESALGAGVRLDACDGLADGTRTDLYNSLMNSLQRLYPTVLQAGSKVPKARIGKTIVIA